MISRVLALLTVIGGTIASHTQSQAAGKPNVIIIMADDMGFSDIGCYGGEINTPNLDTLAANGLRFTQFYNTSRCCPTRASLLTGLYPHQAGIGHMVADWSKPGYRGSLNTSCRTIAEVMKAHSYRTYLSGKWHVTSHVAADGPKDCWPLQRGFDRFYGMISGAGSFYDPYTLCRDNTLISPAADQEYQTERYYFTDAISDHAVRFVKEHSTQYEKQPFFLYVAYTAAHWPMHALPEDIAKYKGKYDAGYDVIRKARLNKAARLGLIDPKQGLTPQAGQWNALANKEREIACMEVYAAMVDRMDQGIGKLVAELKRTGQFENTLIFFLQDNGACAEGVGRGNAKSRRDGPRLNNPSLPPLPAESLPARNPPPQTRDGFPVRQGPNVVPGPADTFVAYGQGWANVSNTPFREYKHWVHEGGISTPLIVHWPAGLHAKGELTHQTGHLIDLAATIYDVTGAPYPKEATPLEGCSLRPVFHGKTIERDALYWEHEGNRAVRKGSWKVVAKHNQPWELYDIHHDRIESKDLAAQHPEIVKELVAKYDAWAKRAHVERWPVVRAKKKK